MPAAACPAPKHSEWLKTGIALLLTCMVPMADDGSGCSRRCWDWVLGQTHNVSFLYFPALLRVNINYYASFLSLKSSQFFCSSSLFVFPHSAHSISSA
jgi:hypothetical protein